MLVVPAAATQMVLSVDHPLLNKISVGGPTRWTPGMRCVMLPYRTCELAALITSLHYDVIYRPAISFRVEANKGFTYSPVDECFVCQKKNHFQVSTL